MGLEGRIADLYVLVKEWEAYGSPLILELLKSIDGITAKGINERAKGILNDYKEFERQSDLKYNQELLQKYKAELAELQTCNAALQQAKEVITKIYTLKELRSVYGKPMGKIDSAIVRASLQNNSDKDIQSIRFKFTLRSGKNRWRKKRLSNLRLQLKLGSPAQ